MIDLIKGTTLIQASAGTGKTYTLCRIALQLTLEKHITLDRILAVTFTEAATEELAARIYALYQSALQELESGQIEEEVLQAFVAVPEFDVEQAKDDLRYSLEVFDEAPISTLHGFCKRSLDRLALETQTPLDAELSQVETQLVEQLLKEYLRQSILEASVPLSLALRNQKDFEGRLAEIGKQSASHPEATLWPTPTPVDLQGLERRFAELPEALAELVSRKDDYLPHLAANKEPFKQLAGKKPDLLACLRRGKILGKDFEWLAKLGDEAWQKGMKKSGAGIALPPAVSLITVVLEQIESAYTSLLFNYKPWLSERLEQAKIQANTISFNDLLHHLNRALKGESADWVKTVLSDQYDAALIDEFQDTDRTQLEIAETLFGDGEHYLFYIGDPKQAIYRFRGADIYAYFQATQAEGIRRMDLRKNYRSTPGLVEAVNTLFQEAAAGFVDERIVFTPVEPGLPAVDSPQAPFRIEHCLLSDPAFTGGSGRYRSILTERAANDFAARIQADPNFNPADAAFLVNSNAEAMALSDALLQRGISSAIRSDRSVFDGKEADDLLQLLASLAAPTRLALKRGVYAAFNRSVSAAELASPHFDENATPFFDYISDWARNWFGRNFDVSLQQLMTLASRQSLGDLDSERRHANLCQLSELLSEARDEGELSPRGLYNWLSRKSKETISDNKDWQARISSDQGKPQVLTLHKSKGLQFPVVILPYLGLKRMKLNPLALSYHGPSDKLVIDYAPDEESPGTLHAPREELAEHVRLFYVGLTRAERETLVYLCPEELSDSGKSAPSSFGQFLLGDTTLLSSEAVGERLQAIAEKARGSIEITQSELAPGELVVISHDLGQQPETVSERGLRNRKQLPYAERVLSFSSLNKGMYREEAELSMEHLEAEELANDEEAPPPEAEAPETSTELSIFSLPKGTHAGDLLHLILERFDFGRPETLAATTQQAFESLQFEPRDYEAIVAAQIAAISSTPLEGEYATFRLQDTMSERRVPELEFSYSVSGDVQNSVIKALQAADLGVIPRDWVAGLGNASGGLSASMMRGFIDLVLEHDGRLYLFDWKSNYLGPSPADYGQEAILESMSEHNYFLQYLLYCVALKRYAEWRFPAVLFEEIFGGVFYIYARGISPGKATGIYYDLPSPASLQLLDDALKGGVAP